jgi:hypothetical protein
MAIRFQQVENCNAPKLPTQEVPQQMHVDVAPHSACFPIRPGTRSAAP